jgi:hypothetical protein
MYEFKRKSTCSREKYLPAREKAPALKKKHQPNRKVLPCLKKTLHKRVSALKTK